MSGDMNWTAYIGIGIGVGIGVGMFGLFGPWLARRVSLAWRRRKYAAQRAKELERLDPVRLSEQLRERETARIENEEKSKRAVEFCQRYAAPLIADGHDPASSLREAQAVWTELNG